MIQLYGTLQEWLMQTLVLPLLYAVGGMGFADDAIDGLDWLLLGLLQILIIALVFRPFEAKPDPQTFTDPVKSKWADIFYTLIHRLGIFRLLMFFMFSPVFFWFDSQLHDLRFARLNVENLWDGVTTIPWVSFLIYLVILDFAEYLYHRASHHWNWWWQLHTLHHSQRYMTSWSDNRNNVLDDLGHSGVFALIALFIGVEPIQYFWLIMISQLIQSWYHGNFNVDLGWGKYVFVSPIYHRLHHAIGLGHEVPGKPGVLGGCNFGILFTWWDIIFGTAIFDKKTHPTGVKDVIVSPNVGVQQWQGIRHSFKVLTGL